MARATRVLVAAAAAVAALLGAVAAGRGAEPGAEPVRAVPAADAPAPAAGASDRCTAGPAPERPAAAPVVRRPVAADRASQDRSTGSLEVRVDGPGGPEWELVLRRGRFEHARGTTRDGRLAFDGLAPGGYLLRAEGAPERLGVLDAREPWEGPDGAWRSVHVASGARATRVELRYALAASLAGVVVDPDGAPLDGAAVLVQDLARPARTRVATTDERGAFQVDGLAPGRFGVALVEPAAPAAATSERRLAASGELALAPAEAAWLELRAEPGVRAVCGRVVDARGEPVAGLRLLCAYPGPDGAPDGAAEGDGVAARVPACRIVARARTDDDGAFALEGLPPAALRVSVDAREHELGADGARRRLLAGFPPVALEGAAADLDLGTLAVARAPVTRRR